MANHIVSIPKSSDTTIIGFFESLTKEFQFPDPSIHIFGLDPPVAADSTDYKSLKSRTGYSIRTANSSKGNFSVTFTRSGDATRFSAPDQLHISNNNALPADDVMKINDLITHTFMKRADLHVAERASSFDEAISSHLQIATRLEESLERISGRFAEERLRIQSEQDEFIRTKQKEFADREALLNQKVSERQDALSTREKDLDDRTNMHARRSIRQDIKRQLQGYASTFSLTTNTRRMRWPIHAVVALALSLLVGLVALYSLQIADWQRETQVTLGSAKLANSAYQPIASVLYILLAKTTVATVAALGVFAWYIRWLNRWFEQHADAEFQLKQFELDVDRASWIVETAMEWRTSQNGAIPESLLASVSRNLFARKENNLDENVHPADYLASAILGKAARVRLSAGGNEIELDRRSMKDINREAR